MKIILDKSYLDAATKDDIEKLCNKYKVLMIDTLFYELITTRIESRQRCFAKFPKGENPVDLIPNIGTLLRYENDNRKPTGKIYKHRIKDSFRFNPDLASGSFKFDEHQSKKREEDKEEVRKDTEGFIERICEQSKLSDDYYGNILIALTEAVNNAITHGNQLDPNKKVNLNMETTTKDVEFTIKDEGLGFDYENVPDPTLPENLTKLSGRGVFLMKNLADEVSFEENGATVKLKFTVTGG